MMKIYIYKKNQRGTQHDHTLHSFLSPVPTFPPIGHHATTPGRTIHKKITKSSSQPYYTSSPPQRSPTQPFPPPPYSSPLYPSTVSPHPDHPDKSISFYPPQPPQLPNPQPSSHQHVHEYSARAPSSLGIDVGQMIRDTCPIRA